MSKVIDYKLISISVSYVAIVIYTLLGLAFLSFKLYYIVATGVIRPILRSLNNHILSISSVPFCSNVIKINKL